LAYYRKIAPRLVVLFQGEEKNSTTEEKTMAANRELTNLHCAKAAPGAKPYRLADKGGLYLLVTPAGGTL
jgi:hypothetical protein